MSGDVSRVDGARLVDPKAYASDGYPYEEWALLRREAPLTKLSQDGWPDYWAVTKHSDIVEISKTPEVFLNAPGMTMVSEANMSRSTEQQIRTIINMDPPDHKKFRRVASPYFTPRAIRAIEPLVKETARKLVDGMGDEGECDFITDVASLHPLKVIARILGVPEEDEPFILKMTNELFGSEDPEFQRGEDRMESMRALFHGVLGVLRQDHGRSPRQPARRPRERVRQREDRRRADGRARDDGLLPDLVHRRP